MSQKKMRTFQIYDTETGESHGRYISSEPRKAAIKAFSSKVKRESIQGEATGSVWLKEITRGSSNKTYGYEVKREKLDVSKFVDVGDKQVEFKYSLYVSALPKSD